MCLVKSFNRVRQVIKSTVPHGYFFSLQQFSVFTWATDHECDSHLLTTSTDDPSLAGAQVIIKVSGDQYRWLACGYDQEIGHF